MNPALHPFHVIQLAYVVTDLETACRKFHELYGIGPFFRSATHALPNVKYQGSPVAEPVVIDVAFAQSGEMNIELLAQPSPGPSAFRDMYAEGEQGLHHVATFASDYDADRQAFVDAGYEEVMDLLLGDDCRICFIDARPTLGHMIELYTDHPLLRQLYAFVRDESERWDGKELIQPLGRLA